MSALDVVVLGLSITSSWGNGHATTYRSLLRALSRRGHRVLFLERDVPWYAGNRDLPNPSFCELGLYGSLEELTDTWGARVRAADAVLVGSYVPEGARVGDWVTSLAHGRAAFYDIDTPVTLRDLAQGTCHYLTPELVPRYALYLSFTGGPTLERIERRLGARRARALYCSVDPDAYASERRTARWDLGYLGTYSADRQAGLEELLNRTARGWAAGRFVVAGAQYPGAIEWPANVERTEHVPPPQHPVFYGEQRFTLNVTRADMKRAGWSPSVRLFEAAACGTPIISDDWPGLGRIFEPGREILVARSSAEVLSILRGTSERDRLAVGHRARARVLAEHTAATRAETLERELLESIGRGAAARGCSARGIALEGSS